MTKNKRIILAVVCLALIAAGIAAFFIWRGRNSGGGYDENAIYMQKVSDMTSISYSVDRYSGVIEAQKTQSFKKDPEKTVEEIYVTVGQEVTKGTPLFKYDVKDAENNIASINLDIEGINNEIAVLRRGGNTTDIQLQISEKELEIRQKQAELEKYNQEIANAEVVSSVDGTVKIVSQDGGYDSSGQELPVVAVTETGEFRVKGKVSEQSVWSLSQDMDVIVRSRVDESLTWTGHITNIEMEPESNNNNDVYSSDSGERASSYPFYVTLDSTDGLMLGQHVFIEPDYGQTQVKEKEGIWLDNSFVAYDDTGNPYVWTAERGKTKKRYVEVGEFDDETYTIEILSGLEPDDLIAWPDEEMTEGLKAIDITEGM